MDRRLRELERESRASPKAGAAYAAALARSGERREAYLTWCRLAREGLAEAKARLRGWSRFSRHSCAVSSAAPGDPAPDAESSARRHVIPLPDPGAVCEATPTTLYLACVAGHPSLRQRQRVVAVDLVSGRQGWVSDEGETPLACCGDDLLVRRGGALVLRDHRDGALKGHLALAGETHALAVHRDRVVAVEGERTRAYDLGAAFGALCWDRATGTQRLRRPRLAASDGLVYAYSGLTVEASDLDTGLTRWRHARCHLLPSNLGKGHGTHLVAGEGGLVVRQESSELPPGACELNWIGADGALKQYLSVPGPLDGGPYAPGFPQGHLPLVSQSAGRIAFLRRVDDSLQLECVELSGLTDWDLDSALREPEGPDREAGRLWARSLLRCDDLLLRGERLCLLVVETDAVVVRVLDATSGHQLYRVRVKTELSRRWPVAGRLLPIRDDDLVAALAAEKELHLIRIALRA